MDHSIRKFMRIVESVSTSDDCDEDQDALNEEGRVVQGVNTTCDVSPNEITKQAAKFGNTVTKDGVPPLIYEDDHLPDESEKSPVPKAKKPELPKPLKALFSRKRR